MSRFAQIIATVENLEEQQNLAAAEDDTVAAQTAAEVAEASADVNSDVDQIEKVDQGIEDAVGAQDKIGELTEIAEDSLVGEGEQVEEGELGEKGDGLTEKEAALVEITHESIMQSLGFQVERKVYTTESFSDKESRRDITIATIESLGEKAKAIGAGIVRALKAAVEMVVGFIAKIINNRALMERHLNNLAKRVAEADNGPKKEAKIKAGASILSLDGAGSAASAERILDNAVQNVALSKKIAETLYNSKTKDASSFFTGVMEIGDGILKLPANGKGVGIFGGGKALFLNIPTPQEVTEFAESLKADRQVSDMVDNVKSLTKTLKIEVIDVGGVTETMDAPDKSQMTKIIASAKATLSSLRDAEKSRSRLIQFLTVISKPLLDGAFFVSRHVGTKESKEKGSLASAGKDVIYAAVKILTKVMTTIFSSTFRAIKGAADYVNAGLKNIGEVGDTAGATAAADGKAAA